jgi:hypothetical protein
MSNMSPQVNPFNGGIWAILESQVRTWAIDNDSLYVVTGPVLRPGLPVIGDNVAVPEYYYKAILVYTTERQQGIGFIMKNEASNDEIYNFAVTIDSVENFTGLDFFPVLADSIENAIEGAVDFNVWFEGEIQVKPGRQHNVAGMSSLRRGEENGLQVYDLTGRRVKGNAKGVGIVRDIYGRCGFRVNLRARCK